MCLAACAALDASMSLFAKASLALPRSLIAIWELSVGMMAGLSENLLEEVSSNPVVREAPLK